MTQTSLAEQLAKRPWLLADGATGTNYFQMGLVSGDAPELWNFEHPDRVRQLHRRFIEAGADIILTNTFGGNRHRLKLHNAQDQVREINIAAAQNARAEADAAARPVYRRRLDRPDRARSSSRWELCRMRTASPPSPSRPRRWQRAASTCCGSRPCRREEELRAAVEGAAETGPPIVTTMSFDTNGRTMMGITPQNFGALTASLAATPGGDRRQLRHRRLRAGRHRARHHRGAARRLRGRQGQLRHSALSRRPYPLCRHARS